MKIITSRTNPLIKHIAALQGKKYRTEHQQFCAEGIRTISTLISAGLSPLNLFVTENLAPQAQKFALDELIYIVPEGVMQKISSSNSPSGLLAQFAIPKETIEDLSAGIVLAQISDPGNMGTLIRSAAAMGKKTVIIIGGTDPWSPKVIQASAGTIGMVRILEWEWQEILEHKKALKLIALVVAGGKNPKDVALNNALLVIGSEGHGLPEQWIADCDAQITLSMPGDTESLNAAIAGSIALYLASSN